jgi:hypothetical protein
MQFHDIFRHGQSPNRFSRSILRIPPPLPKPSPAALDSTIEHPDRTGFLASVLSSLLNLRIETKRLKKTNKDYAGIDSVLKWMLVTCFGYTGYRNAKFGQIQVHERITETSREQLIAKYPRGDGREHGLRGPTWHRGLPVGHGRAYIGVQRGDPFEEGLVNVYGYLETLRYKGIWTKTATKTHSLPELKIRTSMQVEREG